MVIDRSRELPGLEEVVEARPGSRRCGGSPAHVAPDVAATSATTTRKIACRNRDRREAGARQADIARPPKKRSVEPRPLLTPPPRGHKNSNGRRPQTGGGPVLPLVISKALRLRLAVCEETELTFARRSSCRCDRSAGHGIICSLFLEVVSSAGRARSRLPGAAAEHPCLPLYSDTLRFAIRELGVFTHPAHGGRLPLHCASDAALQRVVRSKSHLRAESRVSQSRLQAALFFRGWSP